MVKYRVKIKYGNPGEHKNSSQTINVEAEDEKTAMELAINKFKSSNPSNRDKEVVVVGIEKIR